MQVAIIMGSTSDLGKVEPAIEILKSYGVRVKQENYTRQLN